MVGYARRRFGSATMVALAVAVVSALMLAAGAAVWAVGNRYADQVHRVTVFGDQRPPSSANGSLDILFVATDSATGGAQAGTDVLSRIVLAHLSRHHQMVLVSIPRDSLLSVPRHRGSEGKTVPKARRPLDDAYEAGGPRLLVRTVQAATRLHLDGYVELSIPAVAAAAGDGIDLCLPATVHDKQAGVRLEPGTQRLTGTQARALIRATVGGGLAEVRRLALLFAAVDARLLGGTAPFSPFATGHLLANGVTAIRVDEHFGAAKARRLALALRDPYAVSPSIVAVPLEQTKHNTKHGAGTTWNKRMASYLFDRVRSDQQISPVLFTPAPVPVQPHSIRLRVDNGAGVSGLARRATKDLRGIRFAVAGKPGNAKHHVGATVIYHDRAHRKQAKTVQAAIPGSQLARTKKHSKVLRVVVGHNYGGVRQVTYVKGAKAGSAAQARKRIERTGPCGR